MYSLEVLHAIATYSTRCGVSFTRLGDILVISKPALSNTLKDLVEQKFIEKRDDGLYHVTTKGTEFLERIKKEDGYTAEILRLSMEKLEAQRNITSMVKFIEQRIEADPRIIIPQDRKRELRQYIELKVKQVLTEIYRTYSPTTMTRIA
jgi:DNA-binding MarR family transcriptional regulator